MATTKPPDLGIVLLLAYQGFVRQLHASMAASGFDDLGSSDGVVFRLLDGRSRTVSELAQLMEISKQGGAQIIDDMERRGYVVRRPDPGDARARLVELSDRGRAAVDAARRFHGRTEAGLARRHGPAAVAALRELLDELAGDGDRGLDRALRSVYL